MRYYENNRIYNFSTKLLSFTESSDGFYYIELEDTYFYPEGGGQPSDIGFIDGIKVLDVTKNNGKILHKLEDLPKSELLNCSIDKDFRDHYMIQHSGQHLVSAVLKHELNIDTVSVHLGQTETTIEINKDSIFRNEIDLIENKVNELIWAGKKIIYHETDDNGLKQFNIRRESKYNGYIRIVEIEDYDCVPCGGIHLSKTNEICMVKIVGYEKIRGNIRLQMIIGPLAFKAFQEKFSIINSLNILLSTKDNEIVDLVSKLQNNINNMKFDRKILLDIVSGYIVTKIINDNPGFLVFENYPKDLFQAISTNLNSKQNSSILLINKDTSLNWIIVDSINTNFNFTQFKTSVLPIIDGKGGGKNGLWQGSGNIEYIDEFINSYLKLF
ncbi:MAG: hypothetical protein JXR64_10310 [Spirochaetales bacterium]|nr:hypothetical protein [Spirochaetales bacterium]